MKRSHCAFSKTGKMLLLFLLLAVIVPGTTVFAKVRLSKTRVTIETGRKVTLKVKGTKKKVSWSVSGKKLVTITTKGKKRQTAVIKAGKKSGTCYVTAKVGKKKLRCKITVKKKASTSEEKKEPKSPAKVKDTTVLALADASLKMAKEASAKAPAGTNLLISPQSILTAIALTENGAAGSTLKEMESALSGLSVSAFTNYMSKMNKRLTSDFGATYQAANSVWYREGQITLKDSYLQNVKKSLDAEVYGAPFSDATVKEINQWVSEKTKGKINQVLDRLDPSILTILINTIYFKGEWAEQYRGTNSRTFTDYAGKKSKVRMLEGTENEYVTLGGAEGFVKNYMCRDIAFMALLPPKGKTAAQFLKTISGEDFVNAYAARTSTNIRVLTRMPKFSCEYETSLNEILQKLGIRKAFSDMADFSKMSEVPLKIDEVLHKTYIKVDENGTEAAAATVVTARATAVMPTQKIIEKKVYLDRPFVYALIDTSTGLPLFIGTVEKVS